MKPTTIGILQADGSFFPIVEESQVGVKKLTLTAARPGQESVRIDIRSSASETDSGLHLGTLALQRSGTGDIELVIDLDEQGRLTATAAWPQGTAKQSISVDLKDYHQGNDIPELESFESLPDILEPAAEEIPQEGEAPLRSDREILNDDSLDTFELDDFNLDEMKSTLEIEPPLPPSVPSEEAFLAKDSFNADEMTLGESFTLDLPDFDSLESWDAPTSPAPTNPAPIPKKAEANPDSFDSMDWGDEAEAEAPTVEAKEEDPYAFPDLSMDDMPSLELSDLDQDTSFDSDQEPSTDPTGASAGSEDSFFDEMPAWEPEAEAEPQFVPEPKPSASSVTSPRPSPKDQPASGDTSPPKIDRVSLVLSLITLGLLVAVLLGLLFMNFMRPASPPALRPESFLMPSGPSLAMATTAQDPLTVPASLHSTQVYQLRPGDEASDLERRFGPIVANKSLTAWTW